MLALAILTVATAAPAGVPAKGTPASPSLELSGVWRGREVSDAVGVRTPLLTFKAGEGSLTYVDTAGGAGQMSVRIESVAVQGDSVRFSVAGPSGRRFYRGRWDGRTISGTIAAEASGAAIGTFELRRQEYDDTPRLPVTLLARSRARTRRAPPASVDIETLFDARDEREDRERDLAARRVGQRLSQVAGGPEALDAMVEDYLSQCPLQGAPLNDAPLPDCDRMAAQISRVATAVDRVIDEAEDEARRTRVQPGTVRDLRTRLGVDESDWDRVRARVREIEAEAEAARRRR